MDYKHIPIKRNKKLIFFISFILLCGLGGAYWSYRMNYEMIMRFTLLDGGHPDFPFGEKRVNITPWLKMGYKKIDDYEIYNPNIAPLKKDDYLARIISQYADNYKIIHPELYKFFQHKDSYDEFFKKEIKIKYLYSMFNEDTKAPTDDYFYVFFDDYQVRIHRKLAKDSELPYYLYAYAYDLIKVK